MHRLLDCATQLTNFKWETPGFGPLTYEPALKTTTLAATLLFAHGQTTDRTVTAAERLGRALGVTVRVLPYWGEIIVELDGTPSHKSSPPGRSVSIWAGPCRHGGDRSGLPRHVIGRGRAIRA
jgi:hypothetical protein